MLVAEDSPSFVKMLVLAPAFVLGDAGEQAFVGEMILPFGDADVRAFAFFHGATVTPVIHSRKRMAARKTRAKIPALSSSLKI